MASFPIRLWRKYLHPPQPPTESPTNTTRERRCSTGQEIKDALAGQYGAETRITAGQQSLTLYSAIPIPSQGRVAGAVLVSQSTFRMLSDLYALRLDIFRLFLWSVVTAVVLSLLVSATITVPIRRLRDQAHAILDPRGRLLGGIVASRARDEVGELSRSLGELTARLKHRVRSDGVLCLRCLARVQESRSPRSAAPRKSRTPAADPDERRAMLSMVLEDVSRMERLLTGVREISRIDSGAADEEGEVSVDVKEIAVRVVERGAPARERERVTYVVDGEGATAWLPPGRLEQVVENLVDNAASFSPPGGVVRVSVARDDGWAVLACSRRRPGHPARTPGAHLRSVLQLPARTRRKARTPASAFPS